MANIVEYEVRGKVAIITLNRPEARNAVNGDVASGLEAAIDKLEADSNVWIGVLAANTAGQERPVFCAGADLKAINSGQAAGLNTKRGGFGGFVYRDRKKPVIAAVDGLATAGGCELVLACDMLVASTRSAFGLAEATRNLIAGAGGLFRLPRAIGRAAAMEAILTGEPFSAQRAYELGMVNKLVEPNASLDAAIDLALRVCKAAPLAVWASRKIVLASETESDQNLIDMTNKEF
ncbi:MAG: enoyl-CoA hydratase-related protein, partial [Ilumatobacteraceae bacterium]